MRIQTLRIENYKGFDDSGPIGFGPGFNVIVGQNNSGKTAILEALRLSQASDHPHRTIELPPGISPRPKSAFDLDFILSGHEFQTAFLQSSPTRMPLPHEWSRDPLGYVKKIVAQDALEFSFTFTAGGGAPRPRQTPSYILEGDVAAWRNNTRMTVVAPTEDRRSLKATGNAGGEDQLVNPISKYAKEKIYVFDAQRLNVGRSAFGDSDVLQANASNLPQVLFKMSGNPDRYDRFNRHVTEIFPNIHHVTVVPSGEALEIRIWPVSVSTERMDLASPLNEGGTGVGQILAILYVAMNFERSVIAIDEPNNFLHPGAVKKLINILQDYGTNQYVVATHSTEVIASSDPSTVHTVSWREGRSVVDAVSTQNLSNLRAVLSDLGVSLSDVFGPERIIWVEGQTEQECFPIICRHAEGGTPKGVSFLAMRSTGEVERNNAKANAMMELYGRVSGAGSIMPPVLAFSFDRELRSKKDVEDLRRRKIKTRVLPRRTYENYLLHADAIAWIISEETSSSCAAESVNEWIRRNRSRYAPRHFHRWEGDDWIDVVDAPRMLSDLCADLSEARLEYKKVRHSAMLTSYILDHEPEHLEVLVGHVHELLDGSDETLNA